MTVKFNVQIIYLSIYYIYFSNLFIVLMHSYLYLSISHIYFINLLTLAHSHVTTAG